MQFLCMSVYCFTISVLAQDKDTISQIDITAFEKSLEEKSFDDIMDVFYKNYNVDSLKSSVIIKYLKNNFLNVDNKTVVADSYLTIALWEEKIGNSNKAIAIADKGIVIADSLKDNNLLYLGHLRKGASLFHLVKNNEALDEFLKAYDIARKQNNIGRQLSVSYNIVLIRIQAEDNLGAIDLYHENLKIIQENKDKDYQRSELEIYLGLTKAYINIKEYDKAAKYCTKGIVLSEQLNELRFKAYLLSGLGDIASNTGKFDEAYRYFKEAEDLMKELDTDKNFNLFMKLYWGKTYFFEGKYEKAIAELSEGEALVEAYEAKFLSIQELYYYLAKSYKELGNSELGLKYYDKVDNIDRENDKKRQEISTNIVKKFDLPKLKEEIETLIAKAKRTKYYYYTGIGLLLFVIIGLVVFNRKQQQKNKERFSVLMHQLQEKRQQEKLRQQKLQQEKEASNLKETTSEKREILQDNVAQIETDTEAAEIDDKDAEILKKLAEFEHKEKFLSNESTLVEVAKKIQTNTTYLSKVINTHKEKSFTAYITDLRVDYAIERLSHDRKFRSFTIGAIAQEIGFKRSESFSKAFKVKTGLYPSYFIKELEKQQIKDA